MKRLIYSLALAMALTVSAVAVAQEKEKHGKGISAKVVDGQVIIVDSDGNTRTIDLGDGEPKQIVVTQEAKGDGADVQVKGKAIIIGPDGERHEIDLSGDAGDGVWIPSELPGNLMLNLVEKGKGDLGSAEDDELFFSFGGDDGYMIGVHCVPIDGALKVQLKLDTGFVLEEVLEDSPADQAGLKDFDVLVEINGDQLTDIQQLVDAVQDAGAHESTLKLRAIRSGDDVEVEVVPIKRETPELELEFSGDNEEMNQKIQKLLKEKGIDAGKNEFRFERFGPGIIQGNPGEVSELQAQIEDLRAELKALKAQLRELRDDQ